MEKSVSKKENRFIAWLKKDWNETKILFRSLPAIPFAILCIALVAMNFLANKGIIPENPVFSADSAIFVSWVAFLAGDMMVKCFGAKAAIKVNIAAIGVQLLAITLFTIGGALPWSYPEGTFEATFDSIFMAQFWPLFGGTLAFTLATVVDSILSKFLITRFKNRTSFKAYAVASYASTALGQLLDNMFFALFFSMWQGWFCGANAVGDVLLHLLGFSAIGMVAELIGQAILSPAGFALTKSWRKRNVGNEYIALVKEAQEVNMTNAVVEKVRPSVAKVLLFVGSFLSIVGACVLAVITRLNFCELVSTEFGNDLILSGTAIGLIVAVYMLAVSGFALYVAGSAVKSKKQKVVAEEQNTKVAF